MLLFIVVALVANQASRAQEESPEEVYLAVKKFFDTYGAGDGRSARERVAMESVMERGMAAFPAYKRLFTESSDGQYKSAVVSTMFNVESVRPSAINFIGDLLENSPQLSTGDGDHLWLWAALLQLEKHDVTVACKLAAYALGIGDYGVLTSHSIVVLGKHGDHDDVGRLEAFIGSRRTDVAGDRPAGGYFVMLAEQAVRDIKGRLDSVDGTVANSNQPHKVGGDTLDDAVKIDDGPLLGDSSDEESQYRWDARLMWGLLVFSVLAVGVYIFGRRNR